MKKFTTLLFALILSTLTGLAHAKRDCSMFWANLIGLEAALQECNPTSKFNAWAREERARVASEERVKQEDAKVSKAGDGAPDKDNSRLRQEEK